MKQGIAAVAILWFCDRSAFCPTTAGVRSGILVSVLWDAHFRRIETPWNWSQDSLREGESLFGKRNVSFLTTVIAFLALSACQFGTGLAPKTALPAGTVAPDFSLQVGDQALTLADYQGRAIVISFWASP